MRDSWLTHNTDKMILLALVLALLVLILHMIHHGADKDSLAWAENTFATVLGALILILTGRVNRADGQTANGVAPLPLSPSSSHVTPPAPIVPTSGVPGT